MSIFTEPPRSTKVSFRRGDTHIGVWGIQRFLNKTFDVKLAEDGVFGFDTEREVKHYQRVKGVMVDGIVGPQTQSLIVRSTIVRAPYGVELPKGLLEGIIQAESGRLIAAANSQGAGGIDLGLTQRRVYGPPFHPELVKAAIDPYSNVARSVLELRKRYQDYASRLISTEYCWRIAALAHNWPWGAEELGQARPLSTTKKATWVPAFVKFDDGAPVISYREWGEWYAIGAKAHNHPGAVTRLAFGVPDTL